MLPRYLSVTPQAIREVSAEVLRVDNRVVLTYVPDGPPADSAIEDEEAAGEAEEDEAVAA
jgi:hypothetical protein